MSARENALRSIRELLGPSGVIDDPAQMQPYLVSWRNGWQGKTPFIVRPANTTQVAEIVTICHQHRIAIVPQGGNTGLVGGAIPSVAGDEIVLNLSRMNKIRAIDSIGATVTAEAGAILRTLQEETEKAGFLFPLSMASEGSAQIGGAIATNAGGTAVLRYGNMRNLVLGIEAILPDGKILSGLKSLPKDNTGYDIGQYFVGSEGTLGIITAATLRLFPRVKQTVTGMLAADSPAAVMELFHAFRAEFAEYLSAFEVISLPALRLVVKHQPGARFPGRNDAPYYVLIELGSSSADVPLREMFETAATRAAVKGKLLDAVIAASIAQGKQFWVLREGASEALRKEGPGAHFDISLPLAKIAAFLENANALVTAVAPHAVIAPFGHIGDGNIHYNMCFPSVAEADFTSLKKKIQKIVYNEVARLDGSISAEHGIGVERKAELLLYKQPEAIAAMKGIKHALDPHGIMNPGKIFDAQ